jgi:hypothetical protein
MEERTNVLIVYGYQSREKFAVEVGRRIEKTSLEGVRVVSYKGKPDGGKFGYREPRIKRFLSQHYPFDYAIILHNSVPDPEIYLRWKRENPNERHPTIGLEYLAYMEVPSKTREKINGYCQEMTKKLVNKYPDSSTGKSLIITGYGGFYVKPKEVYDRIDIELCCPLITVEEAVDFLKGLIKTLSF